MKFLAGNDVWKSFACDKLTSTISVTVRQWNQWGPAAGYNGSCEFICDVRNITKGTHVQYYHQPVQPNDAVYFDYAKNFALDCDLADTIEVHFLSPDTGNAWQRQRVRNPIVTSDAVIENIPA